jgi:uncharacterized protein (DUF924 family)
MGDSMETPQSIQEFWFGADADANDSADDDAIANRQSALWWRKDAAVDDAIRTRFAGRLAQAAAHALDAWADTPSGRLALILLTDQFSRNMYRGTPASFATDALARQWCMEGLARGEQRRLRPIERVFFYLPLEHSEALEDQQRAVTLFQALVAEVPAGQRASFDGFLRFAERHRDVIARFGRFPHRNAILGRPSTPEELAFLSEQGSSF